MADEEFKVEVELGSDEHGLSFWEKLRTLNIDDDARSRLGGRVTVTRDGNWIQLYASSLQDASQAEKTVRELVVADDITAEFAISRWDAAAQEWVDPSDGEVVDDDAPSSPTPDPSYVILEAYKPEFLRDLGL